MKKKKNRWRQIRRLSQRRRKKRRRRRRREKEVLRRRLRQQEDENERKNQISESDLSKSTSPASRIGISTTFSPTQTQNHCKMSADISFASQIIREMAESVKGNYDATASSKCMLTCDSFEVTLSGRSYRGFVRTQRHLPILLFYVRIQSPLPDGRF